MLRFAFSLFCHIITLSNISHLSLSIVSLRIPNLSSKIKYFPQRCLVQVPYRIVTVGLLKKSFLPTDNGWQFDTQSAFSNLRRSSSDLGLSGKKFPSIDFCMSGPGWTPRAVPAHEPAKSGLGSSVCVRTYLARMADTRHKSNSNPKFFCYLCMILSSVHFAFLLSTTIDVADGRKDTPHFEILNLL